MQDTILERATHQHQGRQVFAAIQRARILWRNRWLGLQAARLEDLSLQERLPDAHRPGAPARITQEQVCQILSLACEAPSQWTGREIADEAVKRGIVDRLSPRHAARLLERGTCNPTGYAIG